MTAESVFEMETSNRIQMANNTLLISLVQCWACNFPSEFWKRKKKSLKSHLASVWPWLSSRINDNCASHMIAFAHWSQSAAITWAPLRIHQQFGLTREITIPIPTDRTNKRRARNRAAKQQEWNKKNTKWSYVFGRQMSRFNGIASAYTFACSAATTKIGRNTISLV